MESKRRFVLTFTSVLMFATPNEATTTPYYTTPYYYTTPDYTTPYYTTPYYYTTTDYTTPDYTTPYYTTPYYYTTTDYTTPDYTTPYYTTPYYYTTTDYTTPDSTTPYYTTPYYYTTTDYTTPDSTTPYYTTPYYYTTTDYTTPYYTTTDYSPTTTSPYYTTTSAPLTTTASPITTTLSYCNVALTATATVQYFYILDYVNNMNCYISLGTASTSEAILLTRQSFYIEENTYCNYDKLAVFDGSSTSATLIGEYCGTSFPASVQSSGGSLYLLFTTDSSVTYTGFSFSYSTADNSFPGCASGYTPYVASVTPATISLPNYNNLVDEYYLINATGKSATENLVISITSMDIEKATGCIYDRLVVYNGPCKSDGEVYNVCGTSTYLWQLPGNTYLVHFHSDSSVTKTGFSFDFFISTTIPTSSTTTTTTLGPPVAVEIDLMESVLTNYSADNSPRRDLSIPLSSTVDAFLVGVNGLDEVSQKLTTTILFNYKWTDEQISWSVNKQGGVKNLLIPQDDIYKPDFALMNGFTKISQMGAPFMFVVVENTGLCTWKPYQILDSVCKVDMTNYPFDTQICDLKFSTWSSSADDVTVQIGQHGIAKHESFVENSQWTLLDYKQLTESLEGKQLVVFRLTIKRNPSFIMFYVTTPIILLSFASAFTFVLPVSSGEKSGYGITVFLSFVVYLIVTFQKMPANSETLSLFAMYVLINTFLSGIAVMIVTIQVRLDGLSTKIIRLPNCLATFSRALVKLQDKFMCVSLQLKAQATDSIGDPTPDDDDDDDDDDDSGSWADFSSAINFVLFWLFTAFSVLMTVSLMGYLAFQ